MHDQMKRLYQAARTLRDIKTQAELARLFNTTSQKIKNWENRGISKAGALEAEHLLGCATLWLMTGEGDMLSRNHAETAPLGALHDNVIQAQVGSRRIPIISYVQAGQMAECVDNFQPGDAEDWVLSDLDLSKDTFALRIKGDSMLPEFKEGDCIIVDPHVSAQPGDFVVAKNGNNEATFKKYKLKGFDLNGNEIIELHPLNDNYPVLSSETTRIQIIGVLMEHRRYRRR